VFTGETAHAGATPMPMRRDTFMATAQAALAIRDVGFRHEGVCTVGGATSEPGVVTAVPGRTEMLLDQRHLDPATLAIMLAEARAACEQAAADHGCAVELQPPLVDTADPVRPPAHRLARQAVQDAGGKDTAIPSGPLHDAAEMARLIPTVMLFSSSSPTGLAHEGGGHAGDRPAGADRRLRPYRRGYARERRSGRTAAAE
jgi:N-carbamoyl-L-amino-acid hydrolase